MSQIVVGSIKIEETVTVMSASSDNWGTGVPYETTLDYNEVNDTVTVS